MRYQVAACEGKGTGEQSLLANLLGHLNASDVVLADALLASGWIVEGASRRGVDVVMAQHGARITDFARGQRLGQHYHVMHWPRPPKPKTMSAEDYARYPAFIAMREVEVKGRILVTTRCDPQFVSTRALDALYKMRWNIGCNCRIAQIESCRAWPIKAATWFRNQPYIGCCATRISCAIVTPRGPNRPHDSERSEQAALLLQEIAQREGIAPGQVVLHSDNGGPMKGVTMLAMLQRLGVVPSFSRPGVSLESNFVTPAQRHDGDDRQVLAQRKHVYAQARARHPERWSGNTRNWERVETVLLNPEKSKTQNTTWAVAA